MTLVFVFRFGHRGGQQWRWRSQAEAQSHHVFGRTTREAGEILRANSLPRRLRARGDRAAHRTVRVARSSLVQQPPRALAQASEQRPASGVACCASCSWWSSALAADERQRCVCRCTELTSTKQPAHSLPRLPSLSPPCRLPTTASPTSPPQLSRPRLHN